MPYARTFTYVLEQILSVIDLKIYHLSRLLEPLIFINHFPRSFSLDRFSRPTFVTFLTYFIYLFFSFSQPMWDLKSRESDTRLTSSNTIMVNPRLWLLCSLTLTFLKLHLFIWYCSSKPFSLFMRFKFSEPLSPFFYDCFLISSGHSICLN